MQSVRSAEAALKYFIFGGISAAFALFGLSLIYGLSNSTNLTQIARAIKSPLDPLLFAAIVMVVVGFGFKVAAVPFHFWAPDVYEGAPTTSASLIASSSKVAGFVIFYKVMAIGFAGAEGSGAWRGYVSGWVPVIATIAALSMVLGIAFLAGAWQLWRRADRKSALRLYLFSMVYLALLFATMVLAVKG